MTIINPESFRLLYVDNSKTAREALKRTLEREKYFVLVAASGAEALDLIAEHQFHLIITDLYMPYFSGIKLVESIIKLNNPKKSTTPIIVYSGSLCASDKSKCLSYGVADFISKKDGSDQLLQAINNILSKLNTL